MIRVDQDLDSIFVDGYLPAESQHEPELCIRINGVEVSRERALPGLFSLHAPCKTPAGKLLVMKITCDKSYCPARAGTGTDERELAILLREIRLIGS
jgi:hypothetical protein